MRYRLIMMFFMHMVSRCNPLLLAGVKAASSRLQRPQLVLIGRGEPLLWEVGQQGVELLVFRSSRCLVSSAVGEDVDGSGGQAHRSTRTDGGQPGCRA